MKKLLLFFLLPGFLFAQSEKNSDLYKAIKTNDSLMFGVGFNTCNIKQFENLLSEDFEFYHDKSGVINSKKDFIASLKNGLCKSEYKSSRELIESLMEVFPLEKNGVLYGAIQVGRHRFFETVKGVKKYRSTARFTHIWVLENGKWKFLRGLSYDHLASI